MSNRVCREHPVACVDFTTSECLCGVCGIYCEQARNDPYRCCRCVGKTVAEIMKEREAELAAVKEIERQEAAATRAMFKWVCRNCHVVCGHGQPCSQCGERYETQHPEDLEDDPSVPSLCPTCLLELAADGSCAYCLTADVRELGRNAETKPDLLGMARSLTVAASELGKTAETLKGNDGEFMRDLAARVTKASGDLYAYLGGKGL
ncbi:MAG: hypothetical protein P8Y27_04970 [Chromatiaceae bacterium]